MKRFLFKLQRLIGRYPYLYYPLYTLLGKKQKLAVNSDTEIVIEGFPRSANSFSVVAFEQAQKRTVNIAHHLHIPAQVIRGVRKGLPVIVLVRHPVSAVCSLVLREPYLDLRTALQDYIHFYEYILPYRKHFLVARFEDVTGDYANVINELNEQFGTDFLLFEHTEINVKNVFDYLDCLEQEAGSINEDKVARPSNQRKESSDDLVERLKSRRYETLLVRAIKLYKHAVNNK